MGKLTRKIIENEKVIEIYKSIVFKTDFLMYQEIENYYENWSNSDQGKFVLKNCVSPLEIQYHKCRDSFLYHTYIIIAEMPKEKLLEFYLKWNPQHERF